MSKKKKHESKKERKKRCEDSWTKKRGIHMLKSRAKIKFKMPECFEEAVKMGILR